VNLSGLYDSHLQSSWTHLITPSRNFVEVRWRYFFRMSPRTLQTALVHECDGLG